MSYNKASQSLSIAIPTSFIDVYSNNAQKTQIIGRIARAAAIFQVDEILVYIDKNTQKQQKNLHLIKTLLEYIETPQYLRKHLFRKLPELRHAGLLPPLRTPHHPIEKRAKAIKDGEIREGYAFDQKKPMVDIGTESPIPLLDAPIKSLPTRLTVQINRRKDETLEAIPCPISKASKYWGFEVFGVQAPLAKFLVDSSTYSFVIATSRKGKTLWDKRYSITKQWKKKQRLLLLFGSHKEGLPEIFEREGYQLSSIADHTVNLLQRQGVVTVRTEEAVFIGLASFRFLEQV